MTQPELEALAENQGVRRDKDVKAALETLPSLLEPAEDVEHLFGAKLGKAWGVLAVTSVGMLFVASRKQKEIRRFPFDAVSAVSVEEGHVAAAVEITASDETTRIDWVKPKESAKGLEGLLRLRVGESTEASLGHERKVRDAIVAALPETHSQDRAIDALARLVSPDEEVLGAAQADFEEDTASGTLVVTDRRAVFMRRGSLVTPRDEQLEITTIGSARFQDSWISTLEIRLHNGTVFSFKEIKPAERGPELVSVLRSLTSPSVAEPASPTSLLEELGQLHSRGVLTDQEFEAKKAELLKRL